MPVNNLPLLPAFGFETKNCNADQKRAQIWNARLTNIGQAIFRGLYAKPRYQKKFESYVIAKFETDFQKEKPKLIKAIKAQVKQEIERDIGTTIISHFSSTLLDVAKGLGLTAQDSKEVTDEFIENKIEGLKQAALTKIKTLLSDTASPAFKEHLDNHTKSALQGHISGVCTALKVLSTVNKIVGYIPFISLFAGLNQLIALGAMNIVDRLASARSGNTAPVVENKKAHFWSAVVKLTGCGCVLIPLDILLTIQRALADPKTPITTKFWTAL